MDNVVANAGSGGSTFAADDIGGVLYPRSKVVIGADGSNDGDVSAANPMPVKGTGTAGTANAGVMSIQGIASMTPVQIGDNSGSITVDNGGTFATQAAQSGTWTVQPGNTANTTAWLVTGTGGTFPVTDSGGSLTVDGTVAATQSGTWNVGTVTTVTTVAAVTAITNALPAGTNAIGKLAANSGVDIGDVDVTSISAGTNTIGDVGVVGRTTGGLTLSNTISAASTNATSVKASAGQVFSIFASNVNAAARYLKLYNKASAPTVGTDTPVATFLIPGNTAGAGFSKDITLGLAFSTGIAFAITTGVANADTGAVAASELVVVLGYK